MTLFILYFIKVNVALAVLYLFYKLLFSKDTFFGLRRLMLILIYITAFTYPLLNFSNWIITDSGSVTGQVVSTLYKNNGLQQCNNRTYRLFVGYDASCGYLPNGSNILIDTHIDGNLENQHHTSSQ